MNIGIDLDDVLFATGDEVEKMIDTSGNPRLKEYKVELMRGVLAELPEDVVQFLKDTVDEYCSNAKPLINSIEVLKKLKSKNHRIIFITARDTALSPNLIDITYESFKKYGIEEGVVYDKIVFFGSDKASICKQENIDLFIDDSPKTCEIVRRAGFEVIAFKSKITADTIDQTDLPSVSSWDELYDRINSIV